MYLSDLHKQLPKEPVQAVQEAQDQLEREGIVCREVVVVCRKAQVPVSKLPSIDAVREFSDAGLRCSCGRPFAEERIEEALTITEKGRSLLDKSRWFSWLLLHKLTALGIDPSRIALEQQSGGDEMDCIADISGEIVFFELKDKAFNLNSAYSFGAKIGIISPDYPVIVTSDIVGNDAKEHFKKAETGARPRRAYGESLKSSIRYIEGLENFDKGVEDVVSEIYTADARQFFSRVLDAALISPDAILASVNRRTARNVSLTQAAGRTGRSARRSQKAGARGTSSTAAPGARS